MKNQQTNRILRVHNRRHKHKITLNRIFRSRSHSKALRILWKGRDFRECWMPLTEPTIKTLPLPHSNYRRIRLSSISLTRKMIVRRLWIAWGKIPRLTSWNLSTYQLSSQPRLQYIYYRRGDALMIHRRASALNAIGRKREKVESAGETLNRSRLPQIKNKERQRLSLWTIECDTSSLYI